MPVHTVANQAAIETLREAVLSSAKVAVDSLRTLLAEPRAIDALAGMKFSEAGRHPVEDRNLNLVEQINQTFTYLVSLAAAADIIRWHPDWAPLRLNLGTTGGSDLESDFGSFAAEAFAAVRATNNRKLLKDVLKVSKNSGATQVSVLLLSRRRATFLHPRAIPRGDRCGVIS